MRQSLQDDKAIPKYIPIFRVQPLLPDSLKHSQIDSYFCVLIPNSRISQEVDSYQRSYNFFDSYTYIHTTITRTVCRIHPEENEANESLWRLNTLFLEMVKWSNS